MSTRFNTSGINNGSRTPFNFNQAQLPPGLRDFIFQFQHMAQTGTLWPTLIAIVLILILLAIVLRLVMAAVGTIGQIGLINGAWQAEEGAQHLALGALLGDGWKSFWKVILFKLLLIAFNIVLAIVLIFLTIITLFCGLILIIPASIVWSFVYWVLVEFALNALVGDSMGIMDAIRSSWELFKKNWMTTTIMGILLSVINLVYALVMLIPLVVVLVPAGIGIFAAASSHSMNGLYPGLIASGVLLLIYIPIAIFLNGVKVAYVNVNWTLVYRQLAGHGTQSLPEPKPEPEPEPVVEPLSGEAPSALG